MHFKRFFTGSSGYVQCYRCICLLKNNNVVVVSSDGMLIGVTCGRSRLFPLQDSGSSCIFITGNLSLWLNAVKLPGCFLKQGAQLLQIGAENVTGKGLMGNTAGGITGKRLAI